MLIPVFYLSCFCIYLFFDIFLLFIAICLCSRIVRELGGGVVFYLEHILPCLFAYDTCACYACFPSSDQYTLVLIQLPMCVCLINLTGGYVTVMFFLL